MGPRTVLVTLNLTLIWAARSCVAGCAARGVRPSLPAGSRLAAVNCPRTCAVQSAVEPDNNVKAASMCETQPRWLHDSCKQGWLHTPLACNSVDL
eukprot:366116-Chlamydomonas_euryale.AAC.11